MLPTYTRLGTSTSSVRRALRTREKFLILLLFATLAFVCFGGLFYLPDDFVSSDKVREVYNKFQNAGPEIFIPAPPVARHHHQHGIDGANSIDDQNHGENHLLNDRNRLHAKIQGDWNSAIAEGDHLEKPQSKTQPNEAPLISPLAPEKREVENPADGAGVGVADAPDLQTNSLPSGEDSDPVARERRNKIREVSFQHFICATNTLEREIHKHFRVKHVSIKID